MEMIRVAIVDDSAEARTQIRQHLITFGEENSMEFSIDTYSDGIHIADEYDGQYDVVFCDMQMKHMGGMNTASVLREKDQNLIIIFVTNFSEYAVQGYEVGALGYLLKPVNYTSFCKYMHRAVKLLDERDDWYLVLHQKNGIQRLPISDIYYMEHANHYIIIYMKDREEKVRMNLSEMEALLEGKYFSRVNNGCIVNLKHVKRIIGNDAELENGFVPISRSRKKDFMRELATFLGGNR